MKDLKYYLKKAKEEKWAIPQFNFSTIEQLKAIINVSYKLKTPVILGTSEGEANYLGMEEIVSLVKISKNKYKIPLFLNLDHGKNLDLIKKAIFLGYDSVHFDGSSFSLTENIKITRELIKIAHKKNILVEGEIGSIKGESQLSSKKIKILKQDLTSVSDVEKFVKETKVDSLAVSIGNIHGVYKKMPKLDFKLLKDIKKISKNFLVLHGGSGIENKEIKKAIREGIVKINFNTEIRIVWKNSLRKYLKNKNEFKPYKILNFVQNDIEKKLEEKVYLLNSNNKL